MEQKIGLNVFGSQISQRGTGNNDEGILPANSATASGGGKGITKAAQLKIKARRFNGKQRLNPFSLLCS
jgi:hypothetical protein